MARQPCPRWGGFLRAALFGAARAQLAAAVFSAAGVSGLLSVVSAGIALQVGVHTCNHTCRDAEARSARTSAKDDIFVKLGWPPACGRDATLVERVHSVCAMVVERSSSESVCGIGA